MSIKVNSIKCPACGADLTYEESRTQLFCSYCGTKVVITNENEYVYHHIDEAEIKKAEADREIALKRIELEEKKHKSREKTKKLKIIVSIVLGVIALICLSGAMESTSLSGMLIGLLCIDAILFMWVADKNKQEEKEASLSGKIKLPDSIEDTEGMNYIVAEEKLRAAGFTNISSVPLEDLVTGILKKPGTIDEITIGGEEPDMGKRYYPTERIVISYHSMK